MPPAGYGARSMASRPVRHSITLSYPAAVNDWRWLSAHSMRGWAGNTYRVIAEVLFGIKRIPEHAWKTHDLRNRTIRLVQSGFGLMAEAIANCCGNRAARSSSWFRGVSKIHPDLRHPPSPISSAIVTDRRAADLAGAPRHHGALKCPIRRRLAASLPA